MTQCKIDVIYTTRVAYSYQCPINHYAIMQKLNAG